MWITSLNPHSATFQPPTAYSPLSTLAPLWYSTSALGQSGRKGDGQHGGMGADFVLYPLIHTLLGFALVQDVENKKAESKLRRVLWKMNDVL